MLIKIESLFTQDESAQIKQRLETASWVDGKVTAGHQSAQVKRNRQLPESDPTARAVGELILQRLARDNVFMSAALPHKIFPPLFNRYESGEDFGFHIDNAIRAIPGSSERVRTDLSATLFFSDPDSYDGGELVIEDTFGSREVKLPAGHMVLYPGTSLHKVNPVTRGSRISAFFWMQSLVREDVQRGLLLELDVAIQTLNRDAPGHASIVQLTGVYHNLLRQWANL